MKKYIVPIDYIISGHIEIEAKDVFDAQKKARKMNKEGVDPDSIIEPSYHSNVFFFDVRNAEEDK
jgi:hypothetical protein